MTEEMEQFFNDCTLEEDYAFRIKEVMKLALARLLSEGIITEEDVKKAAEYIYRTDTPLEFFNLK